jgi:flotillin
MVHIVQSQRQTTSFGRGYGSNVYYHWPRWVPWLGITVIELPVSNFSLGLKDYEAYDKDRVPFVVDVVAFFRIKDTGVAAQRVSNVVEMENQLRQIVQGSVRKVLASAVIDTIMLERAQFGQQFTSEVQHVLEEWGVEPVKSMELMDIRDHAGGQVIHNIMAKKISHIEMESRVEVAGNHRAAEIAEIAARQLVEIQRQQAEQVVGERTAAKEQAVGVAQQLASQEVLTAQAETQERDMAVRRVQLVRQAEITRDQQIVAAEQDQRARVIVAEGLLEAKRREATGIQVEGEARANAEQLMQIAPVVAQIQLAKEIGQNPGYQHYLAIIESVKAHIVVGGKQAEALKAAEIKVIANTGKPTDGVASVMDLFSSKGGTELAAMIEAFAQTPIGENLVKKFVVNGSVAPAETPRHQ